MAHGPAGSLSPDVPVQQSEVGTGGQQGGPPDRARALHLARERLRSRSSAGEYATPSKRLMTRRVQQIELLRAICLALRRAGCSRRSPIFTLPFPFRLPCIFLRAGRCHQQHSVKHIVRRS